jgi:hypothetical protein
MICLCSKPYAYLSFKLNHIDQWLYLFECMHNFAEFTITKIDHIHWKTNQTVPYIIEEMLNFTRHQTLVHIYLCWLAYTSVFRNPLFDNCLSVPLWPWSYLFPCRNCCVASIQNQHEIACLNFGFIQLLNYLRSYEKYCTDSRCPDFFINNKKK